MRLEPGTRVLTSYGRTGTVVRFIGRNAGYRVELDEPKANAYEPDFQGRPRTTM